MTFKRLVSALQIVALIGAAFTVLELFVKDPPALTLSTADTANGAAIFQQLCAGCHGSKGEGQYGKKLNEGALLQSIPDKADEVKVVQNGRGLMPSFKDTLTVEQIDAVVDFTRTGLQTAG
jgi:mono/diheme cytochrome c family protein